MAYSEELLNIINSTDIIALASKYMTVEKKGKNYRALCPFHDEKTPSFVISPEKKLLHCFGCKGGGDPIYFLMQIENIDFQTAVSKLAEFNGIEYSRKNSFTNGPNLSKYHKIMQIANNFYIKYLTQTKFGTDALEYLHQRGLSDEIIKEFNIGLSPKIGDTLYTILKESDCLELDIADVGLIDKNINGYYDLFTQRIMFPIYDEMSNPIGYSARWYQSNDPNQPKYINSRETILFKKSQVLFNLNKAKGEMMRKRRVVLCEGQMDVIACYKAGIKEAVCTMGTALTIDQAGIIKKYCKDIVICYDGDKAGISASSKAITLLKQAGFNVRLCLLPDGMDPDEFVNKKGIDEFRNYFENNLIDDTNYLFTTAFLNKNLNDSYVVNEIKGTVFNLLNNTRSNTIVDEYLPILASKLNSHEDAIRQDYDNFVKNLGFQIPITNDINTYNDDNYILVEPNLIKIERKKYELRLFMYARSSKEKAFYIDSILSEVMDSLTVESQRLWITLINNYYQNYDYYDEAIFLRMLDINDVKTYIDMLEILRHDITPYSDSDLSFCLNKIREVSCDKKNVSLKNDIVNSYDINKQVKLFDEMINNKKKKLRLKDARRNKNGNQ